MTAAELRTARGAMGLSQARMAALIGRSLRHYKAYELGEYEIPQIVEMAVSGLRLATLSTTDKKDSE